MKIYDISRPVFRDMALFPGNLPPEQIWTRRMADGGKNNLSTIKMGSHTGTHVDAPFHFVPDGVTLDDVALDAFLGCCRLIEIDATVITRAHLMPFAPKQGEILLVKTPNSRRDVRQPFDENYVGFDLEAAQYLVSCGIKTIGIDYLSVEDHSANVVHAPLLHAGLGIIEGLYFKDVLPGDYFLSALPVKIEGAEGAPCRAVLIDFDQ